MTRPDDDRPCFRCGRLWREHPVPGTTVCRCWIEPRGRTHEPMVARDRRDDPPPPWLAELIAADDADEAILALHREALVAIADVLDAHRPWDEQGAARKVIFALHNRNLLVEEHRGPPLNEGVRWTTDDVFPPRECEPRCLDPNCRGCHPRTAAGTPVVSVATSHQRDCPTCASARAAPDDDEPSEYCEVCRGYRSLDHSCCPPQCAALVGHAPGCPHSTVGTVHTARDRVPEDEWR